MKKTSRHALSRSDRALMAALAIVLVTASASVGAAMKGPSTEQSAPVITEEALKQAADAQINLTLQESKSDLPMTRLLAEHRCLAEVMYYEARGEGRQGQMAIADVVFQRMKSANYGQSICAVVYEGATRPGCQFSFACTGELAKKKAIGAWREAEMLAAKILTNEVRVGGITGGATNFHAVSVQPIWADELQRTVQIGNHIFYRSAPRARNS